MQLKDRVAIVTGAARGIGQAYCLALAREGAKVVAATSCRARRPSPKSSKPAARRWGSQLDVANAQSTQAMAAQTLQRFGRIDILVNNAAVYGG